MPRSFRSASAFLNSFTASQRPNMLYAGGPLIAAYNTAPQIKNASIVMADTALNIGLIPGFWLVELNANIAIANPAHNIRWTYAGPDGLVVNSGGASGVSAGRSFLSVNGSSGQEDPFFDLGTTINGGAATGWTCLRSYFGVQVLQAGTLMFQFAQGTSGASNTQLLGGSTLKGTLLTNNLGQ